MAYSLNFVADFGPLTGLTVHAKIFDAAGVQVGSTVTSGVVALGGGVYQYLATLPDGHRGALLMFDSGNAARQVAFAVNPEEAERVDTKISTRSTFNASSQSVTTDAASRTASKATVSNLATAAAVAALPSAVGIRSEMDANSSRLAAIKTETAGIANLPTAAGVRSEIDTNSTKLAAILEDTAAMVTPPSADAIRAEIDASSSKLAAILEDTAAIAPPPTAAAIRAEMDTNSSKLAAILEDTAATITPPSAADIRNEMDANSTKLAAILEDTSAVSASASPAAIRAEIDANSTKLAAILEDTDAFGAGLVSFDEAFAQQLAATARAQQAAVDDAGNLIITAGSTFEAVIGELNIPANWQRLYFTVKGSSSHKDSRALVQIRLTRAGDAGDGLLRLDGEEATVNQGSLAVDVVASTVTIRLDDEATQALAQRSAHYDLKLIEADGSSRVLAWGAVAIWATPTAAVS